MKKLFVVLGLFLLSAIFCLGQNVYVAGCIDDGNRQIACYWHNEKLYPSENSEICSYSHIFEDEGRIYVTSLYSKLVSYERYRRYFEEYHTYLYYGVYKNGVKLGGKSIFIEDSDDKYVYIYDAEYCNGDVYVTGYVNDGYYRRDDWYMWVNGTPGGCSANTSIASYAGTIYRASKSSISAFGQTVSLSSSANIIDLCVAYGITYAFGYDDDGPCYWIDGMKKALPHPRANESYVASVKSVGVLTNGNVHAIVRNADSYFYWCGNEYITIPNAEELTKVFVFDDKIYLLGRGKYGAFSRPCYWILREVDGCLQQEKQVVIPNAKFVSDIVVTE